MATIYLFREHEKYQVGKGRLNRGAVFETNIIWISLVLLIALGLLALAGNSLRWQWRFDATGAETIGTVSACDEVRGSKGGYTSYVEYSYLVNEQSYYGRDNLGGGRLCHSYPIGNQYPVYYLSDAPQESGIGAFLQDSDWTASWIYAVMGFLAMSFVFYLLLKNRKELYKHTLLQRHADMIIEATIEKVGEVTGKNGYKYANYVFVTPDGLHINRQIRTGRGYPWPKTIQRHDTLKILYLDNENFCVL